MSIYFFLFYYITEGLESVSASLRHSGGKKSAKLRKMVVEVMAATVVETHSTVCAIPKFVLLYPSQWHFTTKTYSYWPGGKRTRDRLSEFPQFLQFNTSIMFSE